MKPIKTLVLVKPHPPDDESKGGIIIAETGKKRKNIATVISVGEGTINEPMTIKVGDVVHNVKDCGNLIDIDGVQHFFIEQRDILAINN